MQKQKKLVCGVGNNDADYQTNKYETMDGKRKLTWQCPYYKVWVSMLVRCYNQANQTRRPTYIGCTVSEEWLLFSNFRNWMDKQPWEGKQLDKDLLAEGNKVYSAETCVFVPVALNTFLNDRGAARGALPIGVSLDRGRYNARCSNPFTKKQENLGLYDTPAEAHAAWRKRKHEFACRWADAQDDPRIAKALINRYSKPQDAVGIQSQRQ